MIRPSRRRRIPILVAGLALALSSAVATAKERLELRHVPLELPGAPAAILAADVDGDGRGDLVVAVAYTEWDQIGIEETAEMDDVEGLLEVLTIVPSLMDRRELWVFLGHEDGGYRVLGAPLALDRSVLSFDLGPPGMPVVALTDDGLSALRLAGLAGATRATLKPVLAERPVLAGTGNLIPGLGLAPDLDADGRRDLLFPTPDGAAVYLTRDGGLDEGGLDEGGLNRAPASRLAWPDGGRVSGSRTARYYPLPEVRDVDGDGLPDLLLADEKDAWKHFEVFLNAGDGRFAPPAPLGGPAGREEAEENGDENEEGSVVYFGDLDGDGVAEWVTQQELGDEDAGMRQEIRQAKRPPYRYRFYRSRPDLSREAEPYQQLEFTGYAFDGDDEIRLPGGFQDLDGDGRLDLVTLTLDFSLLQAVRILTTRRISIGMDFHVACQDASGRFRAVPGLDLSGKFRLDLDDLRIGQMSQFAGDFDADGRADFVQMGRGRDVTVHLGRAGCVYPPAPDLLVRLEEEPRDLKLVQVRDLDADGLADLLVIQPQKVTEPGVTPPVRLDLYLSGGGR